jgi:hypothetical protein
MSARNLPAFVVLAVLTLGPSPGRADEGPPDGISLTGYWKLNRNRSDDPRAKTLEALEALRTGIFEQRRDPRVPYPGPYGSGTDARSAAFSEIDRPKELTIAQRATLVLIQDGDDEGSVRGVHTDGRRRPMPAGRGDLRGRWEDGRLVVETWRNNGLRVTESYDLSLDPRELRVTVEITAPGLPSILVTSLYEHPVSHPAALGGVDAASRCVVRGSSGSDAQAM